MSCRTYLRLSTFALALTSGTVFASTINPLDSFTLKIDNSALTTANTSFDALSGVLTFTDLTQTYTFIAASASPLFDGLSVTRTCVTLNIAGCASSTVSVSNADAVYGALQAKALVGATLQATGNAAVSNLVFAHIALNAGAESALVGYPSSAPSPTPEPDSLILLSTGLLGAAAAYRRRHLQTWKGPAGA